MSKVIFLEFYDKENFPPGKWLREPDFCYWEKKLPCIAVRDMGMGIWKGFVGVDDKHPFYGKGVDELLKISEAVEVFFSVYGGLSGAGRLPAKFKEYAKNYWWIGIETSHGGDLMPLFKLEANDPDMARMLSNQTYKDFKFIRKEINKLASCLSKIK
jgi:hypothetical protein